MDNKKLGVILIVSSIILIILLLFMRSTISMPYDEKIKEYIESGEACPSDPENCPHEQKARAHIPLYIGIALLIGIMALGIYLLFFEKSQKEIMSVLEKQKKIQTEEEKFGVLLMGLDDFEKKVIKAVREQDGITQQTLRLRTDMHKSKLSIVLDNLEKKGLLKRIAKGKTKQVFIKFKL